jgi:uncharacterized membrane protein YhhN
MEAFLGAATLAGLLDIWVVAGRRPSLENITKPLATLLLLGALIAVMPPAPKWTTLLFAVALLAAAAGDVALLPAIDRFLAGLLCFLLAHLAIIAGLNLQRQTVGPAEAMIAIACLAVGVMLLRSIEPALRAHGRHRLVGPIRLYATALLAMAWSALSPGILAPWPAPARGLLAAGALLFVASDVMLAWNHFVSPLPGGRWFERLIYRLGMLGLTAGIIFSAHL